MNLEAGEISVRTQEGESKVELDTLQNYLKSLEHTYYGKF
jgi:hypothetical protein